MGTRLSSELCAWAVFLLGGFLTVYVILITEANLSGPVIRNVLLPGTAIGLLIMFVGALGIHKSKEASVRKVFTSRSD